MQEPCRKESFDASPSFQDPVNGSEEPSICLLGSNAAFNQVIMSRRSMHLSTIPGSQNQYFRTVPTLSLTAGPRITCINGTSKAHERMLPGPGFLLETLCRSKSKKLCMKGRDG